MAAPRVAAMPGDRYIEPHALHDAGRRTGTPCGHQGDAASVAASAGLGGALTPVSTPDLLRSAVAALEQVEIPYMLTGSLAAAWYGASRISGEVDRPTRTR
jgi:hypothetical protein